jgi:uncharacterized membrane protein
MMDVAHVFATWLHTLAFVIAWGYYGILGRMVLPGLERSLERPAQAAALVAIERRALPLVAISLALFTVTGTYLLVIDPRYAGLGNFSTTWATLMLVKHVLVVILVLLGVGVDRLIRAAAAVTSADARVSALHRVRLSAEGATALGALIVLLTGVAQASA